MTAVYHKLSTSGFSQNWSNLGLITTSDDWNGVPSIIGYLGDNPAHTTANIDARTVLSGGATAVDVIANQTNTSLTDGGVAEFHLANPTVALQGSGTADAPNLVIHLDASGRKNVTVSFNVRDLDGSADNAVQQVVLQYRTSPTGDWKNVPNAYIADATLGGSATLVTAMNAVLPADANNAATLQLRILTTNASGSDEWVGIDDIVVTSEEAPAELPGSLSIADAGVTEGNAAAAAITFTVTREGGSTGAVSATWTLGFGTATAGDFDAAQQLTGIVSFADGATSATVTVLVQGDTQFEGNETFTVTLSAPTGGASLADAVATGTIANDDVQPPIGGVFINEIHYDNAGADVGEAIEIAAPAGTSLTGWTLVFYNGGTNGANATAATVASTVPLSSYSVSNQDDGFGTVSIAVPGGIQNGPADGVALVNAAGQVVQFLSWEGKITAAAGTPAAGLTSTDIGVDEGGGDAAGRSLRLTGSGASYEDFSWAPSAPDSFGAVNQGQDFIGGNATGLVSVADVRIVEGNDGVQQLVFTVRRAGGLAQEASLNWNLATGTAGLGDLVAGQPLAGTVHFGLGVSSVQVVVGVAGDTVGEPNEQLSLLLSNPEGNIALVDSSAIGTIVNDDPIALKTYEIQGEGHRSAYEGQPVITGGIVTVVAANGFYLQDPSGDGNARTSDAVFVFTGTAPAVAVGDSVRVDGAIAEFLPGGDPTNLSTTQVNATAVSVQSSGNPLPAAVKIGTGGILPPTETIDDDSLTVFDPENDGIDFYETLEGMRVTIEAPLVVANSNEFGETFVVASGGAGATGINSRGGITISDGDYNPEKIQIDTSSLFPGYTGGHSQGDILSDVTGIMSYGFNSYELLVTEAVTTTKDVTLTGETTALAGGRDHLTIASYNVENLDPTDSQAKFDLLASNIVYSLKAPDIIAVQEIQDADGAGNGSNMSGQATAQKLIDAIVAAGGPTYVYVEIAPAPNSSGGEPGGNIRTGYFYNADRVSYIAGSAQLITDPVFNGTRKPLVADFLFNGETVRLINVHFTSRGGSDALWGSSQPPADAGDSARAAQGAAVAAYVNNALAADPSLKLGVLGDFNGFWFEDNVTQLEGGVLTNLHRLLPEEERYSYFFEGNAQALDNFLVSGGLLSGAQFDAVHINADLPDGSFRATDHDPTVGRFLIEHPNEAPLNLAIDDASVDENAPAGTLVGTVKADDPDADTLVYSLVDDAGGRFAIDPATGKVTTLAAFDHEATGSFDIVVRATDPDGLHTEKTLTITVADVNEAPANLAVDDSSVDENAAAGTLVGTVSATDPDGDTLAYSLVDDAAGRFAIDPATGKVTTLAAFDHEATGSFAIVVRATDPDGLHTQKTLTITVADVNEDPANLAIDDSSVDENAPIGTLVGTVSAGDPDGDTLAYSLVDDAGGRFAIDPVTGRITTLAAFNHEATGSFQLVVRATDPGALYTERALTITVTDVNEAPSAGADVAAVGEDGTTGNLVPGLLGNDSDPDAGDSLSVTSVDRTGTLGTVFFDAATQMLTYSADHDSFDWLKPGETAIDRFSYTVVDEDGLTSTATVEITVTGHADGVRVSAGNGRSEVNGTAGEDHLSGGNAGDVLRGLDGHDWLDGGNGADALFGGAGRDVLVGGNGNDVLAGGTGADLFVFSRGGGSDTVTGFELGVDRIVLDGVGVRSLKAGDVDGDGVLDLTVAFTNGGGSVTLLGVSALPEGSFAGPEILVAHPAL